MKKVLALALGMLLIPFTAFGMQVMTDADMESVTGQSGVAISVNDIVIYTQGQEELWYQNDAVWNIADNELKGSASVGLVRNMDDDAWQVTYINGLFWTGLPGEGGVVGVYDSAVGADNNLIGSRGKFGLRGNYNDMTQAGGTGSGFANHINTTLSLGSLNGPQGGYTPAANATVAQMLTPRPIMISVQSNLFQQVNEFWNGIDETDGIAAVVIELGTVEIASGGTETLDIFLKTDINPVGLGVAHAYDSFGRLFLSDSSITAYLSGDIAIAPRGTLFGETAANVFQGNW